MQAPQTAWYWRFFLTPAFGYKPNMAGEWSLGDSHSFFLRFCQIFFETTRGPPSTASPVPAPTKTQTTRHALQLLGTIMLLLKLVTFANILAGASGLDPALNAEKNRLARIVATVLVGA
jgi:hypothetical protein